MGIKANWGGALALAAMLAAMDAGAFFREIDYDFSEGAEKRDNLWMVLGPETRDRWNISCLGTFQPYCNVRPGKYVIPMFGPWTARPAAANFSRGISPDAWARLLGVAIIMYLRSE